jgi:hypothetical protein
MQRKRENIAFALALLAIGYNFLPVKASGTILWIASIMILVIGCQILISTVKYGIVQWLSHSPSPTLQRLSQYSLWNRI